MDSVVRISISHSLFQDLVESASARFNFHAVEVKETVYPGQRYVAYHWDDNEKTGQGLPVRIVKEGVIQRIAIDKKYMGIQGSDLNQKLALNALHDRDLALLTLLGRAGSGKTFITLISALNQFSLGHYDKIVYIKPLVSVTKSRFLGTLPGNAQEKISPFMDSLYDAAASLNIEYKLEYMISEGSLELISPDFLRGRNLSRSFIIVDEVQNLSAHEIVTIATRMAVDSKMIMLGDVNVLQRDINAHNEPSVLEMLERVPFWESSLTCYLQLKKNMRNPLVELIENIFYKE